MSRSLPRGRLDRIYLHWSADDYVSVHSCYHYCVTLVAGEAIVRATHDLAANMRDLTGAAAESYAAHTFGRNSYAAGLAVMAMRDARPDHFGPYPLTVAQIDAMCAVAAEIARAYDIPVDAGHVLTHAEAAIVDGYFGTAEDERWDIARLEPSPVPLTPDDAANAGAALRAKIRAAR